jgi:hypothetical protein
MRQTLAVVALSFMSIGILAHAQAMSDKASDEHKSYTAPQAYAGQNTAPDDPMDGNDSSSRKKKRAKHHKQTDHMKQHNDVQPDKDAPQNHVEYGGAGL